MTDIVERLSSHKRGVCSPAQNSCRNNWAMDEAADEITRLREREKVLEGALRLLMACEGGDDERPLCEEEASSYIEQYATALHTARQALKGGAS